MKRLHAHLALAGAALVWSAGRVYAGITADAVVGTYTPGDLADSGDSQWDNPSAALGPLAGDTLGFGALSPFNPAYDPSQIVGIGPGGELTLQLSAAIPVAATPTLGVFSNNCLYDVSGNGSGVASNPAITLEDPDHPQAIVSVSTDGIHFVTLNGGNPITFSNPANYYIDQPIVSDSESPGLAVTDQFQPFSGNLSCFNGENFNQIKTTLNESAGGNWLSLAGTGLTTVSYVRFDGPSDADFPMFVDSVSGVSLLANDIWNNAAGGGDGTTWNTVQANWNSSSGATTYSDYTYPSTAGDIVTFNDNNNGSYNISIYTLVHPTSITVNTNNAAGYVFNGFGGIGGSGGLTKLGSGVLTLNTSNSYTGPTNISGGTVTLGGVNALPAGTSLTISNAGTAVVAATTGNAYALQVGSLNISGGTLDLQNNALIVHGGTLAAINALVASGYQNGGWNGSTGIISSTAARDTSHLTALGIIVNDTNGLPLYGTGGTIASTFANATPLDGDILVKYTYYGDTDLNGKVDGSDYSRLDNAFLNNQNPHNTPMTGWFNGDFNYDGMINGSDYTLIDNAFNSQAAQITTEIAVSTAQLAVQVPEPTAVGLIGIIAAGLLGRRRRLE